MRWVKVVSFKEFKRISLWEIVKEVGEILKVTYGSTKIVNNKKGIQCHECSELDHAQAEWPNYRKSKGKAMNVTLGDESESYDSDEKKWNFMAFTALYMKSAGRKS
jgi:hypothetical protein